MSATYLWLETNPKFFLPDGMSGIKSTSADGGMWMSSTWYGPDNHDWWRSKCGHTVDLAYAKCPVCGEKRPEVKTG